jgi:hypothetical protein
MNRHARNEDVTRKYRSTLETIPECIALLKCHMKLRDEVFGGEITDCGAGWGILQAVKDKDT